MRPIAQMFADHDWVLGEVLLAGKTRTTVLGEHDLAGTLCAEWAAVGTRLFLPPVSENVRPRVIEHYGLRTENVVVLPRPVRPHLLGLTVEQLADLVEERPSRPDSTDGTPETAAAI